MAHEIHENVGLVLGVKTLYNWNMVELSITFLNRAVPTFPVHKK